MAKKKRVHDGPTRSKKRVQNVTQVPPQQDPGDVFFNKILIEKEISAYIDRYRKEHGEDPPKPVMQLRDYLMVDQIPKMAMMLHAPHVMEQQAAIQTEEGSQEGEDGGEGQQPTADRSQ
jgi:hypothetical protein